MRIKLFMVLLLAAGCFLALAPTAYGAEMQSQTFQAFRLLSDKGLIPALPAADSELGTLDRFELAKMVIAAGEEIVIQAGGKTPAADVLAAISLLEGTYYAEIGLLGACPQFLALTPGGWTGYGAIVVAEALPAGDDVLVYPASLRAYRLIIPVPGEGRLPIAVLF